MSSIDTDPGQITQAYLYGFPLVFDLDQVTRYVTEGVGANPAAAFNTFSHEQPTDPKAAANWLPSPAGDFRPVMRTYEPDTSVLNGSYVFPALRRVFTRK